LCGWGWAKFTEFRPTKKKKKIGWGKIRGQQQADTSAFRSLKTRCQAISRSA
jgi:hypothetical protein